MRILSNLLCASTVLEASFASAQALLYVSEPVGQFSTEVPTPISPNTARLLLAQRLGLSRYHSIQDVAQDDLVNLLATLDHYGGNQRPLFDDDELIGAEEKVLLMVEGVPNPQGM